MICKTMNNKNVGFCHGQCYRCIDLAKFAKKNGDVEKYDEIMKIIKELPKEYKFL